MPATGTSAESAVRAPRVPSRLTAAVLTTLSAEQVRPTLIEELTEALHGDWGVEARARADQAALRLSSHGMTAEITALDAPLSPASYDQGRAGALQATQPWTGVDAALAAHQSRWHVAVDQVRNPWEAHRLRARLVATLCGFPAARAVHLPVAGTLRAADEVRREVLESPEGELAPAAMLAIGVIPDGRRTSGYVRGLSGFGHPELEIWGAPVGPEALGRVLTALARTVVVTRRRLTGDTPVRVGGRDAQLVLDRARHGTGRGDGTALRLVWPEGGRRT